MGHPNSYQDLSSGPPACPKETEATPAPTLPLEPKRDAKSKAPHAKPAYGATQIRPGRPPLVDFASVTARLKPCPDEKAGPFRQGRNLRSLRLRGQAGFARDDNCRKLGGAEAGG